MTISSRLLTLLFAILICLSGGGTVRAATSCRIFDISPEKRTLSITCLIREAEEGRNVLRFLDQFAGIENLSDRIGAVRLRDASGATLPTEIRGDGLFTFNVGKASRPIEIRYDVRLSRALEPGRYALTSSLGPEAAFILAGDIFPDGLKKAGQPLEVEMEPPPGWQVVSAEPFNGSRFAVSDTGRAVFFLSRMRIRTAEAGDMRFRVAIAGGWEFSDDSITNLAQSIARSQAGMLDARPSGNFLVTLAPFPLPMTGLRSAALARGNSVVFMLNPGNDRSRNLKLFQRHLAHEMLHFYLPNSFRVRENFDWFWEGFTRYLGLVTLVQIEALTFQDLLQNLGDEYEAYTVNPLRGATSLIAASPEKFSDAANYEIVYRKGLVVAALYDLELRWQSRGKESLGSVVRKLYQDYALQDREIGNREVLSELGRAGNFASFIADYIEGVREINLPELLEPYGIVVDRSVTGGRGRLAVSARLSDRQKALAAGFLR